MKHSRDCGPEDDPMECNVARTLQVIGSKWTMHILHVLFSGTQRFGQLQRALPGISPKTLSERLSQLEEQGIISKKVFAEVPLHVEYTLTTKGQSLNEIFNQIAKWGDRLN